MESPVPTPGGTTPSECPGSSPAGGFRAAAEWRQQLGPPAPGDTTSANCPGSGGCRVHPGARVAMAECPAIPSAPALAQGLPLCRLRTPYRLPATPPAGMPWQHPRIQVAGRRRRRGPRRRLPEAKRGVAACRVTRRKPRVEQRLASLRRCSPPAKRPRQHPSRRSLRWEGRPRSKPAPTCRDS